MPQGGWIQLEGLFKRYSFVNYGISRLFCQIGVVAAVLVSAHTLVANEPSWLPLEAWKGHYPSEHLTGSLDFFSTDVIKGALSRILDKQDIELLGGTYEVETPIEQQGDVLIVSKCKPHDCPAENATMVVDITSRQVWVSFFERTPTRVSVRCYGTEDLDALPAAIRLRLFGAPLQ